MSDVQACVVSLNDDHGVEHRIRQLKDITLREAMTTQAPRIGDVMPAMEDVSYTCPPEMSQVLTKPHAIAHFA